MVSAMDWNPYSKASVCWGEGDRQSHVLEPQSHPQPLLWHLLEIQQRRPWMLREGRQLHRQSQ